MTTPYCDDSVLESDTGPVNIEINWEPNHIELNWYEDSEATTPMTVGTSSQSCDYDGILSIPSPPSARQGYTFRGWRVRCGFADSMCGLTRNIITTWASNGFGYSRLSGVTGDNEATYGLTSGSGEWAVNFQNNGVVKGVASCNNTDVTITQEQTLATLWRICSSSAFKPSNVFNNTTRGVNCWCKMISYTPFGGSECDTEDVAWVFRNRFSGSPGACLTQCAYFCARDYRNNIEYFRQAMFSRYHNN